MKKMTRIAVLIGLTILLSSCAGGGRTGGGVYHHHHGTSRWWGGRDRIIVVPDKEPPVEATTLPSGPEEMPDMGMPDMGGDFGGDW